MTINCLKAWFLAIPIIFAEPCKSALFQRAKVFETNACAIPTTNNYPVKTWPKADNLTSSSITKEMKECSFFCLRNPNCLIYQVVRLEDGRGFCNLYERIIEMVDVDASVCKSFVKREKPLDCIIRWNSINFKTRTNVEGFRVEKADKSWSIYNNSRGIHIIGLNPTTCQPYSHNVFDTVASASERNRFILSSDSQVSNGSVVIGYAVGNFYDPSLKTYLYKKYSVTILSTGALAFICNKGTAYCSTEIFWYQPVFTTFVMADVKYYPTVKLNPDDGIFMKSISYIIKRLNKTR